MKRILLTVFTAAAMVAIPAGLGVLQADGGGGGSGTHGVYAGGEAGVKGFADGGGNGTHG
jgi:hypothetical protein